MATSNDGGLTTMYFILNADYLYYFPAVFLNMWYPSLISREIGNRPESNCHFWMADLLNGVILRFKPGGQHLQKTCHQMEGLIFSILECRLTFYNIFVEELINTFVMFDKTDGYVCVHKVSTLLVKSVRRRIVPELWVPPQFLELEHLVSKFDNNSYI